MSASSSRAALMVDGETRDLLREEAEKYGLAMAAIVRLLVRKLRAGRIRIV